MKKIIAIASTLTMLSSPAFAKTEGNYLGVYGLLAKVSPVDKSTTSGAVSSEATRKIRLGFNYQHAFNYNNFFFSPEVFIEALEYSNGTQDLYGDKLEINSRYGVKANIGYDINEEISPYITFGRGVVEYSSQKFGNDFFTTKKTGTQASAIYGFGANIKINDSVVANLEYNRQDINLDQGTGSGLASYEVDINTVRFGLAYHF